MDYLATFARKYLENCTSKFYGLGRVSIICDNSIGEQKRCENVFFLREDSRRKNCNSRFKLIPFFREVRIYAVFRTRKINQYGTSKAYLANFFDKVVAKERKHLSMIT